jgi:hypothetical protein
MSAMRRALSARGELKEVAAVVGQAEGDIRPGQRQALDGIGAVGEFGAFGLEKFAAGRGVVIEVAHFDDGAGHQRRRFRLGTRFAFSFQAWLAPRSRLVIGQASDGGDRGQRLAAKAEGADAFEVVERGNFGGGMAGQGQRQLILGDAAAVVGDADQLDAAFFQMHLDGLAAGVEAVFEQFLEHGGGSFDHFASGNLADQQVGEAGDRRHGGIIPWGKMPPVFILGSYAWNTLRSSSILFFISTNIWRSWCSSTGCGFTASFS